MLEGVAAISGGRSCCDDVSILIQELDRLSLIAFLTAITRRGTVIVTVDRTLDGVIRVVSEVHTGLGRVIRTDRNLAGGIVLRTVRVFSLVHVLDGAILDDLHGVVTRGQLGEGVVSIRIGGSRCDDIARSVNQVHSDTLEDSFSCILRFGTVRIAVDITGD